jgi:hypothetical protein
MQPRETNDPDSDEEKEWKLCCSNSSIACVKYFSQLGVIVFTIVFSSVMLILWPHDLEIRSTFMPVLSGMVMLLVQAPEHQD